MLGKRGKRGEKRKKAGLKAGLINNINSRDFEKKNKIFEFGKFWIWGKFWRKLDHYYLLLLIILPINVTLTFFDFFYYY